MREGLNNNFKMNRRSGPFVFITVVAVPALLLWGSYRYAVSVMKKTDEAT